MAFSASKREWAELCSFFFLLAKGRVQTGMTDVPASVRSIPVAFIQREEHDGVRRYYIHEDEIHMQSEKFDRHFLRRDFGDMAERILEAMKQDAGEVESPEGVEEFLNELDIYDLEAQTDDRTDLSLALYSEQNPLTGVRICSRIGGMSPLLDGGRAANLKFEQTGVRFPSPTVNKINSLEARDEVLERILMMERLGGQLKFSDAADKVFRSNLHLIDLRFPRVLGAMLLTSYLDGVTRISELVEAVKVQNPLKIKDELIRKHGYYEHKMKEFLLALALGMRPAKLYNGQEGAVGGMLILNPDGELWLYHRGERQLFADFLYRNTRLERGSLEKDKFGYLERENGLYYFKLNLKIGLLKRTS